MIPEWLIDDTADIGEARVFVIHTTTPRFIGELMPDDEHDPTGVVLSAPSGQTVCRIDWIDPPIVDNSLLKSLAIAITRHDSIRS